MKDTDLIIRLIMSIVDHHRVAYFDEDKSRRELVAGMFAGYPQDQFVALRVSPGARSYPHYDISICVNCPEATKFKDWRAMSYNNITLDLST